MTIDDLLCEVPRLAELAESARELGRLVDGSDYWETWYSVRERIGELVTDPKLRELAERHLYHEHYDAEYERRRRATT